MAFWYQVTVAGSERFHVVGSPVKRRNGSFSQVKIHYRERAVGGCWTLVGDTVNSSGSWFGFVAGRCEVDGAGGVECFLRAAGGQSGEQEGVFVAVAGG